MKPLVDDDALIILQRLTASGHTDEAYVYTWAQNTGDPEYPDGWYGDGDVLANNETINPGESFWIQGDSSLQFIQSSGLVSTNSIAIALRKGGSLIGNPFPTALTLEKFIPSVNDDALIIIQRLTASGHTDEAQVYTWAQNTGDAEYPDGWYGDGDVLANDVIINPGEGLWIQAESSDQYITIVAPLIN